MQMNSLFLSAELIIKEEEQRLRHKFSAKVLTQRFLILSVTLPVFLQTCPSWLMATSCWGWPVPSSRGQGSFTPAPYFQNRGMVS